jgi:hypothetical protein
LEAMTVTATGAFVFGSRTGWSHSFTGLPNYMNTFWVVRRNPRDDNFDQLTPTYLGGGVMYSLGNSHRAESVEIFKSNWPRKG